MKHARNEIMSQETIYIFNALHYERERLEYSSSVYDNESQN
jgi:hypothetical protein